MTRGDLYDLIRTTLFDEFEIDEIMRTIDEYVADQIEERNYKLNIIIELFGRFMPKEIAIDDRKQMAMYEAFHRLKNLAE